MHTFTNVFDRIKDRNSKIGVNKWIIKKRQREGMDVALQNGIVFGRPKVTVTAEFKQAYDRWKLKEITAVKAMQEIGVKKTTFYKLVREYEESL